MTTTIDTTLEAPLQVTPEGVIRVGGTRVTLDTVIDSFHEGSGPEEIALQYPALKLVDVYGAITYYLTHRQEIDEYLEERERRHEEVRREVEARCDQSGIRARLLARRPDPFGPAE